MLSQGMTSSPAYLLLELLAETVHQILLAETPVTRDEDVFAFDWKTFWTSSAALFNFLHTTAGRLDSESAL